MKEEAEQISQEIMQEINTWYSRRNTEGNAALKYRIAAIVEAKMNSHIKEHNMLLGEYEEALEIIILLVGMKDVKEQREQGLCNDEAHANYLAQKPLVWQRAREFLDPDLKNG